jgi:hypothetical protein
LFCEPCLVLYCHPLYCVIDYLNEGLPYAQENDYRRVVEHVKLPVRTDKPNQVPYFDRIVKGLTLVCVVSYGGSKTFRALTYKRGKPQSTTLGHYPEMSLASALKKAHEVFENPKKAEAQAQNGGSKGASTSAIEPPIIDADDLDDDDEDDD